LRSAQAEIEAGRARYFDLYDLAPVGYVTVGEKGLVLEANLTAAALLGVNRAALVRQPLTRFILKKDQDLFYLLRKRLAEGAGGQAHSLQTCELRMLKPDGSYFWAQLDATAAEGPDGAPAYRVVLSDITERRERQQHVELLVRMLDEAPAAITVHDTDGRFLFANRRTLELHGYADMESFLAVNLHKLDVPESETRIAERFAAIERDGEASFEVAHHRTDGSTFPLALVARKIEWQGHPAVLSIAADITDRKQADEALREQMEELQRWHKVTLGREARVLELKREVNELLARVGEPTRYAAVGAGGNGQA
jgi:PAS domain S-box-containing protein